MKLLQGLIVFNLSLGLESKDGSWKKEAGSYFQPQLTPLITLKKIKQINGYFITSVTSIFYSLASKLITSEFLIPG